jgi:hypothetical protein
VRNARAAPNRVAFNHLGQTRNPPDSLPDLQDAAIKHRHPGGIIPPVFQPSKSVHEDRLGLLTAHVTNNSAHVFES